MNTNEEGRAKEGRDSRSWCVKSARGGQRRERIREVGVYRAPEEGKGGKGLEKLRCKEHQRTGWQRKAKERRSSFEKLERGVARGQRRERIL